MTRLQHATKRYATARRLWREARKGEPGALSLSEATSELNTARARFRTAVARAEGSVYRWPQWLIEFSRKRRLAGERTDIRRKGDTVHIMCERVGVAHECGIQARLEGGQHHA